MYKLGLGSTSLAVQLGDPHIQELRVQLLLSCLGGGLVLELLLLGGNVDTEVLELLLESRELELLLLELPCVLRKHKKRDFMLAHGFAACKVPFGCPCRRWRQQRAQCWRLAR